MAVSMETLQNKQEQRRSGLSGKDKKKIKYSGYQPTGSLSHVDKVANAIGHEITSPPLNLFSSEVNKTRVSMFSANSMSTDTLLPLTREFFGAAGVWTAARNNPEAAEKREREKEERFLENNPSKSKREEKRKLREYREKRQQTLTRFKERAEGRINTHFYETAVPRKFAISKEKSEDFVNEQLKDAVDTMEYVHKTIFPDQALPLRNEAALPMTSPADVLNTITSSDTDKILSKQLLDKMLVAHTASEVASLNIDNEAGKTLARIQQVLDIDLFAGKSGYAKHITTRSLFDNDTNRVMHIEGVHGPLPKDGIPNTHIKECTLEMRPIREKDSPQDKISKDALWVYINPDEKKPKSYTAKAIKKGIARTEEGYPDIINMKASEMDWLPDGHKDKTDDVTDTHRIKFVIPGGSKEVLQTLDRVYDSLVDPKNQKMLAKRDRFGKPILDDDLTVVKDISDDSAVNGDKNQSQEVKFKRIQVKFSHLAVPVEIIFQTMEEFLIDTYLTGKGNINERESAAHELYLIKRNRKVAGVFYNSDVYDNPLYKDINAAATIAYDRKVDELKKRKKLDLTAKAA